MIPNPPLSPSPSQILSFQEKILSFYKSSGRHDLPWRHTTNRYEVLVSEIMLQQTQVDRVIPKFESWLKAFPNVRALAHASLSEVLQAWQGLGYNNRAKRLQDACKIIVDQYKGVVPESVDELIALPGIGPYTARSVLIFADNKNLATVDTNIRRILIHEFKLDESTSDKELFALAQKLVPKGLSRKWHNALMDYGATLLTARASGIKPKSTQSKFEGSSRQVRAQILRIVLEKKSISVKNIKELFADSKHNLDAIINSLVKDGLVRKEKYSLVLP